VELAALQEFDNNYKFLAALPVAHIWLTLLEVFIHLN
jgi:hypothetical protein